MYIRGRVEQRTDWDDILQVRPSLKKKKKKKKKKTKKKKKK